jgi:hypothetical protein
VRVENQSSEQQHLCRRRRRRRRRSLLIFIEMRPLAESSPLERGEPSRDSTGFFFFAVPCSAVAAFSLGGRTRREPGGGFAWFSSDAVRRTGRSPLGSMERARDARVNSGVLFCLVYLVQRRRRLRLRRTVKRASELALPSTACQVFRIRGIGVRRFLRFRGHHGAGRGVVMTPPVGAQESSGPRIKRRQTQAASFTSPLCDRPPVAALRRELEQKGRTSVFALFEGYRRSVGRAVGRSNVAEFVGSRIRRRAVRRRRFTRQTLVVLHREQRDRRERAEEQTRAGDRERTRTSR